MSRSVEYLIDKPAVPPPTALRNQKRHKLSALLFSLEASPRNILELVSIPTRRDACHLPLHPYKIGKVPNLESASNASRLPTT
ncbi:hypothetical protein GJ744_000016 [Endocarpon pusillum]|uniref:Uncharacterized protein n=1 Tax=Endocarpon pusillum TaxID=364733 RepID=A0A8H7AW46_9EURO|nr:hypothetical protein GJ744_000016 [Endocarpon pusillum]